MWLEKNKKILVPLALLVAVVYVWLANQSRSGAAGGPPADLTSSLPKMVELYAPSCPSCRTMDPLLEQLKEKCALRGISVDKIDISRAENAHIAEKLGVFAVPTFVFLDSDGKETSRLVGEQSDTILKEHLAALGGHCFNKS